MNAILFWIGMAVAIGTVALMVYRISRWGAALVKGLADVAIGIDLVGSQLLDLNAQVREMTDPHSGRSPEFERRIRVAIDGLETMVADPVPGHDYRRCLLIHGQWVDVSTSADV